MPSLPSVHIYQLSGNIFYSHYPFIDKNNNIWIIGNTKIESFNLNSKKNTDYPLEKNTLIYSSCYDRDWNRIFVGISDALFILDLTTNKFLKTTKFQDKKLKFTLNIAVTYDKLAFINGNDLVLTSKDLKTCNRFKIRDYLNSPSMVNFMHFDKSNRLWMCNDSKGQIILNFENKLINKVPEENQKNLPIYKYPSVATMSEMPNGNIITQGIFEFNQNTKQTTQTFDINLNAFQHLTTTDKYRNGVWYFSERLISDKKHNILYFLDSNKKMKPILKINQNENIWSLQDLYVFENKTILGSFTNGLYWIDSENKKVIKEKNAQLTNPFTINPLSSNRIAVSYINNDMLLMKVLPNQSLKIIKKLLPGIQSFYMQEDSIRKHYWVGTNQGVYLLDKNFKKVKKFDANNGLAGTYIYGLLLDEIGNAYCSHQRGLSSITAIDYKITNFDKNDGIQDWDFNNRAFLKASDGTMYFGGVNGFNYFKPPLQIKSYYEPEVYIDEILINNKLFESKNNVNAIEKLTLNYQQNNIIIKALVKDLANADSRELIYGFQEIDTKWKHLKNGTSINFSNLAPGTYTLRLGYYDKYLNKNINQKNLIICISVPFYLEVWFNLLIAFAITGLIFWFFSRRKFAKQQQVFQQQLALEKQRNKITADLHDDIGATLSSLQINSAVANQLIDKNPKEAHNVLEKIENQSQNLADKISDIIWSMKPGKDEFMAISLRIKNFANDILGSTAINYKIQIEPDVDALIKDITTRKNIILILKEAINNVAKYSKATQLNITIDLVDKKIEIQIIDNGIGFDVTTASGNGIGNMQKRVEELNGKIDIISSPKIGTSIRIEIENVY